MKRLLSILLPAALTLTLTACIQDEPLNAECDIDSIDAQWLEENKDMFTKTPEVGNENVKFSIFRRYERSALAPRFTLTAGARITCLIDGQEVDGNGVTRDFTIPQTYTVHSEDGQWKKNYTVSFTYDTPLKHMGFEHYDRNETGKYYVWYEVDPEDETNPRRDYWASGNAGYLIAGIAKTPEDFPTTVDALGVQGNCVKLVTRTTGWFGMRLGMPIAAGNLFIGTFDSKIATGQPRQATGFGRPLIEAKPLRLEGYYKYTPGEVFTNVEQQAQPDRRDMADIYAVVYEIDADNFVPLDGDNVLTSDRIVLKARIDNPGEPSTWTHFSEEFKLQPDRSFDYERMYRHGYAIAIVATSSRDGAYFEGAVGSTLYVDELHIVYEGDE